jgi:hypothetical protein
MKITILHDDHGQIIATSKTADSAPGEFKGLGIIPRKGQKLLEIELSGGLEHAPIHELYKHYHIDVHNSKLVKKP